MSKFKISASKGQKKYSLVLTAASENEAKERVHAEGYSILGISEIDEAEILGNKFLFQGEVSGRIKKGTIIGKDIFKVYVKLRKDLNYRVDFLYQESDKDASKEEKRKILKSLEEGYELQFKDSKKEIKKNEKKESDKDAKSLDGFYMKKELDETHALIDMVLEKLQNILNNSNNNLSEEKKEKLKGVYNSIIKIKKTTNIEKLKQVGELALLKIGKLELLSLENDKDKQSKELLKDTNKLLKQIGSRTQFKEKNKDLDYIIKSFKSDLENKIKSLKNIKKHLTEKPSKKLIDKESYSFLKTLLLLDKYKDRLKKNNKEIIKNIGKILLPYGENKEIKEKIFLKRRVIKQNISLLRAKKLGKLTSYTGVRKGYKKFVEKIIGSVNIFDSYVFYVVVSYSILFIVYINMITIGYTFSAYDFNYTGIFYFIFILSIFILTSISKDIFTLSLIFVFSSFFLIFGVVNF